ncbi:hypothetical protein FNJ84_07960 [Paracoccus sp. M683]|uniref:hypothetical protein n=1 Tax=Paracoccus sp. M683 TaxID=2594268 RepID=UPI001180BA65|nr:hypothetical protein [Paracoccus sp. M683]TRW97439.1 hypothetical protein FNJ84_07960 [Paracoccus sp. M683]
MIWAVRPDRGLGKTCGIGGATGRTAAGVRRAAGTFVTFHLRPDPVSLAQSGQELRDMPPSPPGIPLDLSAPLLLNRRD